MSRYLNALSGPRDYVERINYLVNRTSRENLAFLSVKDFGAVGDGVTNDTVAVHAARDDLVSRGGGTLYFPRGTYAGNFVLRKWVKWLGEYNGTRLTPYSTSSPVFRNPVTSDGFSTDGVDPSGANYYHLSRIGIEGFVINPVSLPSTWAIDIAPQAESFCDGFYLRDITFQNIYQGIRLKALNPVGADSDTSFIQNGKLQNVRIETTSSSKECLYIDGPVLETHFDVVYVSFNGSGVAPVTIVRTSDGTGSIKRPGRLSFTNLVVDRELAGGTCVLVRACRNLSFIDCYMEGGATGYTIVPIGTATEDNIENVQIIGGSVSSQTSENILLGSSTTNYITKGVYINGVRFRPADSNATNAILISGGSTNNRNIEIGNANVFDETTGSYTGDYVTVLSYEAISGSTPSLANHDVFSWSDNGTNVTDFTNYITSKKYTFHVNTVSSPSYILNSGNFVLSKPFYPRTVGDSITLERFSLVWREISRNQSIAKVTHSTTGANIVLDISGYDIVTFNHSSATNVIEFNGNGIYEGVKISIRTLTANTTITHNSGSATYKIFNSSGADLVMATNRVYVYQLIDSNWRPYSPS